MKSKASLDSGQYGMKAKSLFSTFFFLPLLLSLLCFAQCSPASEKRDYLLIWENYNNAEHQIFLDIVNQYQKANPQLKIKVERVPFDGFLSKLITSAVAKKTPDITRVDIGHIPRLAFGKIAADLKKLSIDNELNNLLPIVRSSNSVRLKKEASEGLYGVTDQLTGVALFYNKKLFKQAGLNPERPPATWQQLIAYGKKLTNKSKGRYGIAINLSVWWVLPILYSFEADVLSKDQRQCTLANKNGIEAITFIKNLFQEHKIEAGAWKAGAINPDTGFINEKYAMIFSGPWNLKTFKKVDYGVGLIPQSRLSQTRSATNIGGTSMVILKNSRYKKEAAAFLKFLIHKSNQRTWAKKLKQISIHKTVNTEMQKSTSGGDKYQKSMQLFMQQIQYARPRPALPNYDQVENILNPILYSIIEGSMRVETGLKKGCQLIKERVLSEL